VRADESVGEQRGGEDRDQDQDGGDERIFQVKIGIRNIVMPGARRHTMVVSMSTPPRMVPSPASSRLTTHRLAPTPGECRERRVRRPLEVGRALRGEEAESAMRPPNRNSE
jgi:hypothetical protein